MEMAAPEDWTRENYRHGPHDSPYFPPHSVPSILSLPCGWKCYLHSGLPITIFSHLVVIAEFFENEENHFPLSLCPWPYPYPTFTDLNDT